MIVHNATMMAGVQAIVVVEVLKFCCVSANNGELELIVSPYDYEVYDILRLCTKL